MKVSATIILIFLTPFLWCEGCSREEPSPPPGQKHKVVMPIRKPASEKAEASLTGEEKSKEEAKEVAEVKAASVEEKAIGPSDTETGEKETGIQEATGYYIVKRGESLSSIAGRDDVYGDPLKWPILYRLNMGKIGKLQLAEGFLDRDLPVGVMLKIITPDEAMENSKRNAHNIWSVNVLSAKTTEEIIPSTIRLIRSGYPVYITSAKVKGKDWMRLSVGFFKNKIEADVEAKKIMTLLNISNSWVTKVVKKELQEFGGY